MIHRVEHAVTANERNFNGYSHTFGGYTGTDEHGRFVFGRQIEVKPNRRVLVLANTSAALYDLAGEGEPMTLAPFQPSPGELVVTKGDGNLWVVMSDGRLADVARKPNASRPVIGTLNSGE